jgi:hypothetical protein
VRPRSPAQSGALPPATNSAESRLEVLLRANSHVRLCWRQVWPIAVRSRCPQESRALPPATNSAESRLEVLLRANPCPLIGARDLLAQACSERGPVREMVSETWRLMQCAWAGGLIVLS